MNPSNQNSISKIFIGSDHAGFLCKQEILSFLKQSFESKSYILKDCGTGTQDSCDYPDFAERVGQEVAKSKGTGRGILICGSGIGMSIAANKILGVRAALVWDVVSAQLSREHNDANILCLGARFLTKEVIKDIIQVWLMTAFQGGRHQVRVEKITNLEKKTFH